MLHTNPRDKGGTLSGKFMHRYPHTTIKKKMKKKGSEEVRREKK